MARVFGRRVGTESVFKKYKGLKDAYLEWDDSAMDAYLMNQKRFSKEKTGKRYS